MLTPKPLSTRGQNTLSQAPHATVTSVSSDNVTLASGNTAGRRDCRHRWLLECSATSDHRQECFRCNAISIFILQYYRPRSTYSAERLSATDMVTMLGDLLERETKFHVKPLPHARIPIVKLSLDPSPGLPHGITCDIGFENRLALENTRLLMCYTMIDPTRVRTLVLFLKVWSKQSTIVTFPVPTTGTQGVSEPHMAYQYGEDGDTIAIFKKVDNQLVPRNQIRGMMHGQQAGEGGDALSPMTLRTISSFHIGVPRKLTRHGPKATRERGLHCTVQDDMTRLSNVFKHSLIHTALPTTAASIPASPTSSTTNIATSISAASDLPLPLLSPLLFPLFPLLSPLLSPLIFLLSSPLLSPLRVSVLQLVFRLCAVAQSSVALTLDASHYFLSLFTKPVSHATLSSHEAGIWCKHPFVWQYPLTLSRTQGILIGTLPPITAHLETFQDQTHALGQKACGLQIECKMRQYLEWELNVDPVMLREFEDMVKKDFIPSRFLQPLWHLRLHMAIVILHLPKPDFPPPNSSYITPPTSPDTPSPSYLTSTSPASTASPPTPQGIPKFHPPNSSYITPPTSPDISSNTPWRTVSQNSLRPTLPTSHHPHHQISPPTPRGIPKFPPPNSSYITPPTSPDISSNTPRYPKISSAQLFLHHTTHITGHTITKLFNINVSSINSISSNTPRYGTRIISASSSPGIPKFPPPNSSYITPPTSSDTPLPSYSDCL
ncbi:hypothetical protein BD769DRAFT_1397451 [Suillus cothurnatus]|nr:hypothetical protein BD769DRAFT_1397451 [Suillus cothurnatus]